MKSLFVLFVVISAMLVSFSQQGPSAADKLTYCCKGANIAHHKEFCSFPPKPNPDALKELLETESKFTWWIKCFTNFADNSACCKKAGVDTGTNETLDYAVCPDLCNGKMEEDLKPADGKYRSCKEHLQKISDCNMKAFGGEDKKQWSWICNYVSNNRREQEQGLNGQITSWLKLNEQLSNSP